MEILILILRLLSLIIFINNLKVGINNEKNYFNFNGIYRILSLSNNLFFKHNNNNIILSLNQQQFHIVNNIFNDYFIITRREKKLMGIDDRNRITFYDKNLSIDYIKISWKLIKIYENKFLIKNIYNKKYIEENNNLLQCINIPNFSLKNNNSFKEININFIFDILKLFEFGFLNKNHLNYINKEPIDIIIKYIDLNDKNLTRIGINQIKKDFDNEELRYSVRSILENIPWIRKIFILMPNEKVRFFKSIDEINEKIIYVKDKDLLGFDSANNPAFLFNLYKMEKFGV